MNPQQNFRSPYPWGAPIPLVRPVSSIEEVKAHPIDFDGSIFYFPDIMNKKIYTKCMNIDGTVAINMYELKEKPVDQPVDSSSFVTRQEFEELKKALEEISQATAQQPTQKFQF